MKIIILILAIFAITFANSSEVSEGVCMNLEVKVSSNLQSEAQTFDINMKTLNTAKLGLNKNDFAGATQIPLNQVGLVLDKTEISKSLDAIHHKYLRNAADSVWFPYSYAGQWTLNQFTINNQMTRTSASKTETPLVSFEFVYDSFIKNLDANDMNKILLKLQQNTDVRIAIKKSVKKHILENQDKYLEADQALKNTLANNSSIQKRLTELRAKLQTTVQTITSLTTTETTLRSEVALKTTTLNKTTNQINEILIRIAALEKQIATQEAELANFKPTDVSQEQAKLKAVVANLAFPQTAPARFKEEFGISQDESKNRVFNGYQYCNNQEANVDNCWNHVSAGAPERKLRRGFF